jgi:hypothetical protein
MIPQKRFLKIVIDQKACVHDFFVLYLSDQSEQLGLHLCERLEQIIECLIRLVARPRAVDDLVGKVDVALDKIHVANQLLVLLGHAARLLLFVLLFFFLLSVLLLLLGYSLGSSRWATFYLSLCWRIRELDSICEQRFVHIVKERQDIRLLFKTQSPFLDEVHNLGFDLLFKWAQTYLLVHVFVVQDLD